ncbi:MAG: hypothetical protein AAF199_07725, partial [Pseudomonadota bacterium]
DILVAAAHHGHRADRFDLKLVLYPGGNSGRFPIGFGGLDPRGVYNLADADGTLQTITADENGDADANVLLSGRTQILLVRGG